MEDEWEEEEQLVVVELSGILSNDFLCRDTCKILDIDSDRPMMQVGQYVFAGEYADPLGTCVLFEEKQQRGHSDSVPELKYRCHTVKKLMMQRIFLSEKKVGGASAEGADGGEQDTTCRSSQEDHAGHQGNTEDKMDSTDLENSAVG